MGRHSVVRQPSWRPTRKVLAGWLAGGGSTVILATLAALTDQVDGGTVLGASVAALAAGLTAYTAKARQGDVGS